MKIFIKTGKGKGPNKLSAFDHALYKAGIENCNLITLSSIIPKNSEICYNKGRSKKINYGDKLYLVLSKKVEVIKNKYAWAGIGWAQDETGKGIFVEHTGCSEEEVKEKINTSLNFMKKYRKIKLGKNHYKTSGIKCDGNAACCALVAAIFEARGWRDQSYNK